MHEDSSIVLDIVLDFMKKSESIYPEVWENSSKGLDFSGVKENTLWEHTSQTDLTRIRISHTQS